MQRAYNHTKTGVLFMRRACYHTRTVDTGRIFTIYYHYYMRSLHPQKGDMRMDIDQILEKQRAYFATGATLPVQFRIAMLKKLRDAVTQYEVQIAQALQADLGKSDFEGFMCETGLARSEISYMIRNIRRFARAKTVPTPLTQFASKSSRIPCPYGNVLIISPWNYPFLLTIDPLADAIAAGNTAIVKPSAYAPATAAVMQKLLTETFPEELVAVVTGGRQENAALLSKKFDMIFFTGSQTVGKEVLRRAAEHLTPAVLELGGKSPCIVDHTANIELAAKRIVFGKFLNCGQTCVAPDYILCDAQIKDALVQAICRQITKQYSDAPLKNPDYGRIVNRKHFDRIRSLIDPAKVVAGGIWSEETLQIAPTVLDSVAWTDPVMQEEIFGPVLPVLTYQQEQEIFRLLDGKPTPLALYIFSRNRQLIRQVTRQCRYGGGCVNDCVIHLATSYMGFGGVGESGMGAYHGRAGFEVFSHSKSVLDKKTWMDLPMRYQPYDRGLYARLLHFFLK